MCHPPMTQHEECTIMKQAEKTILVYGLSGMQMLALTSMAQQAGIVCKAVSDTQTTLTVAQLLSGKEFPPKPDHPLIGKFALLDGFNGQEQLGTAMINQVASGVIKAVHTKHNSDWRFADLCSEIHKEYHAVKKAGQ